LLFAFLEAYARAALLLHWPFDIPGGWVLGALLLVATASAARVFDGSFLRADDDPKPRVSDARRQDRMTSESAARS
jgi:membrane-associated phospholipid phosphatase